MDAIPAQLQNGFLLSLEPTPYISEIDTLPGWTLRYNIQSSCKGRLEVGLWEERYGGWGVATRWSWWSTCGETSTAKEIDSEKVSNAKSPTCVRDSLTRRVVNRGMCTSGRDLKERANMPTFKQFTLPQKFQYCETCNLEVTMIGLISTIIIEKEYFGSLISWNNIKTCTGAVKDCRKDMGILSFSLPVVTVQRLFEPLAFSTTNSNPQGRVAENKSGFGFVEGEDKGKSSPTSSSLTSSATLLSLLNQNQLEGSIPATIGEVQILKVL
ncbi:Uncharacterized protein Fot_10747 [Forsythia ovata]|uniref:Uncharacterized protein n=1 Tax=Forsythia ovata TaxID=205694 RepID=A0ABD1WHY7_9LAMI